MSTNVGLVQIGDSFGANQYYLPYSLGLLVSYAKAHMENRESYHFKTPIFKKDTVSEIVAGLKDSDIVFFSTYLWNFQISLRIAEQLKTESPVTIIVFGGPQVPEDADKLKKFVRDYPFVDFSCYGEGERVFLRLLENYNGDLSKVPSIAYTDSSGEFVKNGEIERISDLAEVPSPYLDGTFDELLEKHPEVNWSVMWETNRGCPFSCAFCAWGAGNKKRVYKYDMDKIFEEIDWFSEKKIEFIFCCDANYGMFERDYDIAVKIADNKKKFGYPIVFSVQNTKNTTDKIFKLQKLLNESGLARGVNLALQSTNPDTLKSISRKNISSDIYNDLQQMFTDEKIATFSDMILGLPDETYETFVNGVDDTISNGQHNRIQFINLSVLENTEMSYPEYIEKHGLILQLSQIISHHTSIDESEEVLEEQYLIVGSKTMPREAWVKTRVFCWLTSLLHFNKLLQIAFVVIHQITNIPYSKLVELFILEDDEYPILSDIYRKFTQKALDIQNGENEFIASKEHLNIYWPVDEYIFIDLIHKGNLDAFYEETETRLMKFFHENNYLFPDEILSEVLSLNKELIKKPFVKDSISMQIKYNYYDVYKSVLIGQYCELMECDDVYNIDRESEHWDTWEQWLKDVVWFGTKRGAYLYGVKS